MLFSAGSAFGGTHQLQGYFAYQLAFGTLAVETPRGSRKTWFMLSFRQALILGIVQGVSGLFPVFSLGHSIILLALLGWTIDQSANYFSTSWSLPILQQLRFCSSSIRTIGFE